ncbi:hypothetical protein SAMN06265218_11172 [Fodinibius sediminis]|uniref:Uncharacterized protein n=1 Tax=Fodinibius sediminis TaxID=1214077 RepID=A0A521DP97_9BACT|nr:hypothetical protein SAMN06265218_11172 [Fodinibius sediminis]
MKDKSKKNMSNIRANLMLNLAGGAFFLLPWSCLVIRTKILSRPIRR